MERDQHVPGRTVTPSQHSEIVNFIAKAEASIVAAKMKHFRSDKNGKVKHPGRWTDANLEIDARIAHEITPATAKWSIDLEEFYETFHSRMCWNVHGSGVVALRFLPEEEIPLLGAEVMHAWATAPPPSAPMRMQWS